MKFFKSPLALAIVSGYVIIICFAVWFFQPVKPQVKVMNVIQISQEWAYFQGQKEALEGDVRIERNAATGKYSWKKSCWDSGMIPIFDPSKSEDMNYFLK